MKISNANRERNKSYSNSETVLLDEIDYKILNILQEDNQLTNLELARRIGLSAPPCLKRVRALRDSGVIAKNVSLIDSTKVGQYLTVFVNISLEKRSKDRIVRFEKKIQEHPEVLQCYLVSGETDYLMVVHVLDMNHYNAFIGKVLSDEAIRMFRSSFCLNLVKFSTKIQLKKTR